MKFTVSSKELAKAVIHCTSVISNRSTLPILGNILISATDRLTVSATDLDRWMRSAVEANIDVEGSCCVPAGVFKEWLATVSGDITLSLDEAKLKGESGESNITLLTLSSENFPTFPEVTDEQRELPLAEFQDGLKRVLDAVSAEETRAMLTGVLLDGNNLVATDTHRLHKVMLSEDISDKNTIIPANSLNIVSRLQGESLFMAVADNLAKFTCGNTTFLTRVIDGQFPGYDRVIPKDSTATAIVNRQALQASLRRIGVIADQNAAFKIIIDWGTGELTASSQEVGFGHETVAIALEGEGFQQGMNRKYLSDVLDAISSDEVTFDLSGALNPIKVESGDFLAVLMPMSI